MITDGECIESLIDFSRFQEGRGGGEREKKFWGRVSRVGGASRGFNTRCSTMKRAACINDREITFPGLGFE